MSSNLPGKTSSTLERALFILECLSKKKGGGGISELSETTQLPKSTIHRILETLQTYGFVTQDPDSDKYFIGLKAIEIGMSGLHNIDLVEAAQPHMHDLAANTGQTSFLAVFDQGEVIYIYKVEGTSSFIMNAKLGTRNPAHCTGLGKAIMAYFSLETVDQIISEKGLQRYTPTTITDHQEFLQELSRIRQRGVAINREELDEGLSSIAAPIFNYTGRVIASVSVAGPTEKIFEQQEEIEEQIREKSHLISKRLGFVPSMRAIYTI
ncbi:IclR family transcriptional regulator [Paenibacillus cisolokensis]|uniref:IclR family transcriptional regulator n=1 Tax=Paenibacillus TaxID=44249 RepID=UPI0001AFDCF0|nr:IclR family transcriptional regulator [Paenibacillus sp. oral taxon 786]EES72352.1 putative pectin degradation repressor protein KdgR [Paenibacillus sp. oral taxon 786 str. D14]